MFFCVGDPTFYNFILFCDDIFIYFILIFLLFILWRHIQYSRVEIKKSKISNNLWPIVADKTL